MLSKITERISRIVYSPERYKQRWMARNYEHFRTESRWRVFLSIAVFCYHNQPINGWYLEFGCHTGRTMRAAWDAFHVLYDWNYAAFDSFEGLPELEDIDRMPIWKKGMLKTSEDQFIRIVTRHGLAREKLITVKGFYSESLNQATRERLLPGAAAVVYIDCDLYRSTTQVLEFIKPLLQKGTVVVFDDWFCFHGDPARGQRRAFSEFCLQHPFLRFEPFVQTNEIQSFIYLGRTAEKLAEDLKGQSVLEQA
jgi:hypothetical protein